MHFKAEVNVLEEREISKGVSEKEFEKQIEDIDDLIFKNEPIKWHSEK